MHFCEGKAEEYQDELGYLTFQFKFFGFTARVTMLKTTPTIDLISA
jgi:hypothetical protein